MTTLRRLELLNWGPFAGEHTLEFTDEVYAVVGTHCDDEERSNWIGKSWTLGSIIFAVTGEHPARTEDGWITRGERKGYVRAVFSDGAMIERKRNFGSSTQLKFQVSDAAEEATQKYAEVAIASWLCMSSADMFASCFVRQKQIERMVTASPSERTQIVAQWMELGPLQRAEDKLRDAYQKLADEYEDLGRQDQGERLDATVIGAELIDAEHAVDHLRAGVQRERTELELISKADEVADLEVELESINERGAELKAGLELRGDDQDDKALSDELAAAREVRTLAKRELEMVAEVAENWSGECPITCTECPVKGDVEQSVAEDRKRQRSLERRLSEADKKLDAKLAQWRAMNEAQQATVRDTATLDQLRARANEVATKLDDLGEPPAVVVEASEIRARLEALEEKLAQARAGVQLARQQLARAEAEAVQRERRGRRRGELERLMRDHRDAVAVVGRNGAQRDVAEGELARISEGANTLLEQAGIDLGIEVSWAREASGLARYCDCGQAFPSSQRVKSCGRCGAERGPHTVERLDIVPSSRSGAADDLAGLAVQLSAAAWLRGRRGSAWSTVLVDEPFGALDAANRRALSEHLHALLRGRYAFEQAFLVAHDRAIMDAMPRKVIVCGQRDGHSTLRVE